VSAGVEPESPAAAEPARDPHSYARPDEARVTHLSLDAALDFDARVLRGRVALDLDVAPGARALALDTRDLAVHAVTDGAGRALPFALGDADPVLGRALTVELRDDTARVVVDYETSPAGAGLLWLAPEQTAGGAHPFVFSSGHAILTRSWLPTQDSVGVRQTWDARVTVPDGLTVVMSAEHLTPAGEGDGGSGRRFAFRMAHPIPTYLIALAAGDVAFRPVGPRTGVFAESALVDAARHEFAEVETMLAAAEGVAGPYRWGRADLLVLPPSFPFGGMENPRLTYVSPTLLAGDRSLTTLVAHELAHAWSGNLVTPATWSDFWLNEGFTVYLELRINEVLYGAERAAMLEAHGMRELGAEIARLGADSPDTRLHVDLVGRDPAVAVTAVPYIKGAAFLRAVERAVGRPRFDAWLRGWFERHAFASVTTEQFVRELRDALLDDDPAIDVDAWVHGTGLPADAPRPVSVRMANVEAQAAAFALGLPAASVDAAGWSPQEWRHFLNALPRDLPDEQLADLDETLALARSRNAEVLFAWLRLALRNAYAPALPAAERFLLAQGRGKFVRPLYAALAATAWGAPEARRIYALARPRYHASIAALLDPIVGHPRPETGTQKER
jgi:leukotriene-A4 hydrolase